MINKIKKILNFITNLILFINLKGHNFFKQFPPEINLPSCYTLDIRSSDLPEFVLDDIKSQTLEMIKTESKFKKLKFDKLRVNFEVRYSKGHPGWQRSIWLYYLDGQLYDIDGQDRNIWLREQKLKQLLGE